LDFSHLESQLERSSTAGGDSLLQARGEIPSTHALVPFVPFTFVDVNPLSRENRDYGMEEPK
jgi:hypothetical protein